MDHELHSTLDASQLSLRRAVYRLLPVGAIAAAVIIVPLFVALGLTLESLLAGAFVACFSFAWIYFVPIIASRRINDRLPRRVVITRNNVTVSDATKTDVFNWADCRWFLGTTKDDEFAIFLVREPAIVVETPSRRIACVPLEGDTALWLSLLETNGTQRRSPLPWWLVAIGVLVAGLSSLLLGYVCNAVLATFRHGIVTENGWLWPAGICALVSCLTCVSAAVDPYRMQQKIKNWSLEIVCGTYSFAVCLPIAASVFGAFVFGIVFTLYARCMRRLAGHICAYRLRVREL